MPLVNAWHCSHTKQFFLDKEAYKAHLRKLAKQRGLERKERAHQRNAQSIIQSLHEQACTLSDICNWLISNSDFIWSLHRMYEPFPTVQKKKAYNPGFKIYGAYLTGYYTEMASNSHSSPQGQPTNFMRGDDLPLGFPGIVGDFKVWYYPDAPGFLSDTFERLGLCTGTGGARPPGPGWPEKTEARSWNVTIWLDDWPGLRKQMAIDRLGAPNGQIQQGFDGYAAMDLE